ncbi:MAG: helix-turn-helix domain-containing protein [Hyphomonadaceae bacterium]|nr:helix-turn-helix domain-containing protein [Hyphomonadaceae bacterium]MBC6412720.1 helix-turn-helix domain-containing protein [Hyphomonadaceae bacterium]
MTEKSYNEIPNFDSVEYGGDGEWLTPEPLNYEPLFQRSDAYDWSIKAHRHSSLTQIFFLTKGKFDVNIDGSIGQYAAPTLLFIPPMSVHGFEFERESDGHVLSIQQVIMPEFLNFHKRYQDILGVPIVMDAALLGDAAEKTEDCFSRIKTEFYGKKSGRLQMLQSHVAALLVAIMRTAQTDMSSPGQASEEQQLAQRFSRLVETHFQSHRPNGYYAKELGISTSKLSVISNNILGTPPQRQAHNRLILEAKRSLVYTSKSAAEIAHELGFNDPAYFSRFFKKMVGTTPAAFRKETPGNLS